MTSLIIIDKMLKNLLKVFLGHLNLQCCEQVFELFLILLCFCLYQLHLHFSFT